MNDILKCKIQNIIRLNGPISRTTISEKIGISMTAVTNYVSQLLNSGEFVEVGTEQSTGGRKPISLRINKNSGRIISIDFGQKFFRIAIGDMEGNILYRENFESEFLGTSKTGLPHIYSIIENIKKNSLMQDHKLISIGMGVSGIIDYSCGTCITIPNIPGWNDVPFKQLLEEKFNIPVWIDDSSRLQAIAEASKNNEYKKNLIYINLGVGLGTGIIIDWRLFRGANGLAGELGHIIVKEDGYLCGCGNKGCLERYVSVPSIMCRVKELLQEGVNSSLSAYIDNNLDLLTPELVSRAADNMDKLVYNVILETGKYLGIGLAQIITLFNPNQIVIGGGGANISDDLIDEAIKIMRTRTVSRSSRKVEIVKSSLGDTGALSGAIIMVLDQHFRLYELLDDNIYTL
jgi:N-acetylglucosamine repressor